VAISKKDISETWRGGDGKLGIATSFLMLFVLDECWKRYDRTQIGALSASSGSISCGARFIVSGTIGIACQLGRGLELNHRGMLINSEG